MRKLFEIEFDGINPNAEAVLDMLYCSTVGVGHVIGAREIQPGPTPQQQAVLDAASDFVAIERRLYAANRTLRSMTNQDDCALWITSLSLRDASRADVSAAEVTLMRAVDAMNGAQKGETWK